MKTYTQKGTNHIWVWTENNDGSLSIKAGCFTGTLPELIERIGANRIIERFDLIEEALKALSRKERVRLGGYNYGFGKGSGKGDGYGCDYDYGFGRGDGCVSGNGNGCGSGNGYGCGSGNGNGYGFGNGYGYGSGDGSGDGYGNGCGGGSIRIVIT
jgi:hypothetical protein